MPRRNEPLQTTAPTRWLARTRPLPTRATGLLRQWRIAAHLDQGALAEQVKVGRASISRWESGDAAPPANCIAPLAAALHRSEQEVIEALEEAIAARSTNDPIRMVLGMSLREWRQASGQTLKEVGQKVGVKATTVASWEAGRSYPRVPEADLEVALGVPTGSITRVVERASGDLFGPPDTPLSLGQRLASAERMLVRAMDILREVRQEMEHAQRRHDGSCDGSPSSS